MKTKIYILLLIIAAGISKSPMVFAEGKPLTDLNVITYSQVNGEVRKVKN
jgi:hypothetical protein